MGAGYSYKCKKCGHKYFVSLGIGMGFPTVYRDLLADISEGKYGSELQEIYNNTPYAAIDGERVCFFCSECGTWELGTDVSLYAPIDPESISQKQYGIKTVAEWGYVPYVMSEDLGKEYHLIKRYIHQCCNCGKQMRKASSADLENLPCPECGTANQAEGKLLLD